MNFRRVSFVAFGCAKAHARRRGECSACASREILRRSRLTTETTTSTQTKSRRAHDEMKRDGKLNDEDMLHD
jgi:predicted ATP-dependent serine protease